VAQCPYEGNHCFQTKDSQLKKPRAGLDFTSAEPNTIRLIAANRHREKGEIEMKDFGNVVLGPSLSRSCPAVLYKLGTLSTICNACTRVFVSFFLTVENKRLVNPTPKRKAARWNRAGCTSFQ